MDDGTLTDSRMAEYRQRRRVELLRDQVFSQDDPAAASGLASTLLQAEEELGKYSRERRALESAHGGGLLFDTSGQGLEPGGGLLGPATTQIDAQVLLRMSHVPTGIVHLLSPESDPLVTFKVAFNGDEYVRLRLSTQVDGYSAEAVDTVEILASDEPAEIHQLPTFFLDRLQHVTELTRASLRVRIDDLDNKTELERSYPIWLLARTTAYIGIEDPATGQWKDLGRYFAAWVTPNTPEVMAQLRKAADMHPEHFFAGYQVDAAGVEAQVKAIFESLQASGVRYIHSVLYSGVIPGQYKQRVRLPREVLADSSANCIDGTILMASLLEAASLNPGIVLVPGHAFLAWETEEDSAKWDYIETTMISTSSFEAARDSARQLAEERMAAFAKSQDPYDFQLLSLAQLRVKLGITPME